MHWHYMKGQETWRQIPKKSQQSAAIRKECLPGIHIHFEIVLQSALELVKQRKLW